MVFNIFIKEREVAGDSEGGSSVWKKMRNSEEFTTRHFQTMGLVGAWTARQVVFRSDSFCTLSRSCQLIIDRSSNAMQ